MKFSSLCSHLHSAHRKYVYEIMIFARTSKMSNFHDHIFKFINQMLPLFDYRRGMADDGAHKVREISSLLVK